MIRGKEIPKEQTRKIIQSYVRQAIKEITSFVIKLNLDNKMSKAQENVVQK